MLRLRRYYRYIGLLILFIGAECQWGYSDESAQEAVTASRRTAIVTAVSAASPAIVNISAVRRVEVPTFFDEWMEQFWREPLYPQRRRSLREVGSGVIVDEAGYILTNHHVINDADNITVAVSDGREFTAQLVGYDYFSDLALLKVDTGTALPEIQWGDSENLLIGEWVVAIGNPFGLSMGNAQPTVTVGIVSATQRSLTFENYYHENLIQTDASINPGNSGGALVNIYGELIGINTVIRSTSGGSQGVGFAIPANKARHIVQQLSEYGTVVPPYIGLEVQPSTADLAEKLSMPRNTGVLVSEIEQGSPIAGAGIKRGDVIVAISGRRIKRETGDFIARTRLLPLNRPISCEFIRRGKKRQTEFTLKTRQWNYTPSRWGVTFSQPDEVMARKYERPGVVVTHVDKSSGLAGVLKRGDFIYQVGDIKVNSLEIFKVVAERVRSQSGRTLLHFERDGISRTVRIFFNRNNRWR